MKWLLLLVVLASSCKSDQSHRDEDYVLIEFASRLEEDYQKLTPDQNNAD